MAEGLPDALLGGAINRAVVEENRSEVLRVAAFPRRNTLHRAPREMGRPEHAIFTCDRRLDPQLGEAQRRQSRRR